MKIASHFKSALSLFVITVNLVFWSLPLMLLGLTRVLVPSARRRIDAALDAIYRAAVVIDDAWLRKVIGVCWEASPLAITRDESVIVISNHASWADILMIQSLIARRGPILKFLAKRELARIPIFGLVFWAFDFPVLRRRARRSEDEAERRRQDVTALREACRVVRGRPAALMNFVEGTRFDDAKRRPGSAYRHLLEPRVGGLNALLDALDGEVAAIVDVTLIYPGSPSFWRFLSGESGPIRIDAARIDIVDMPRTREGRADWLSARWAIKEHRIESMRNAAAQTPFEAERTGGGARSS